MDQMIQSGPFQPDPLCDSVPPPRAESRAASELLLLIQPTGQLLTQCHSTKPLHTAYPRAEMILKLEYFFWNIFSRTAYTAVTILPCTAALGQIPFLVTLGNFSITSSYSLPSGRSHCCHFPCFSGRSCSIWCCTPVLTPLASSFQVPEQGKNHAKKNKSYYEISVCCWSLTAEPRDTTQVLMS